MLKKKISLPREGVNFYLLLENTDICKFSLLEKYYYVW
jgi:hypothetical protein